MCVVSVVLERMKVEQDVAIGHVIEELRSCREQIIPTLVRLCYVLLCLFNASCKFLLMEMNRYIMFTNVINC